MDKFNVNDLVELLASMEDTVGRVTGVRDGGTRIRVLWDRRRGYEGHTTSTIPQPFGRYYLRPSSPGFPMASANHSVSRPTRSGTSELAGARSGMTAQGHARDAPDLDLALRPRTRDPHVLAVTHRGA